MQKDGKTTKNTDKIELTIELQNRKYLCMRASRMKDLRKDLYYFLQLNTISFDILLVYYIFCLLFYT